MKKQTVTLLVLLVTLVSASVMAQSTGLANLPALQGPFPDTENMVLLGQLTRDELGASPDPSFPGRLNDIWGWTSPAGEEYALIGHTNGLAFVRVTDPANPVFVGIVESEFPFSLGNIWGDPATFGNVAYFVSEVVPSSMVIVDLSGLDALGSADTPLSPLPAPVHQFSGGGYAAAHNVRVNEASGFAYLAGVLLYPGAGANACSNPDPPRFNTLILDLNADPINPTVVACLDNIGEHDFHVVNYNGPDADHQGQEIAFVFDGRDRTGAFQGGFTEIWDVTDKANIVQLASFRVPGLFFSHNGWLTEEQDFLFIGDELDELVMAIAPGLLGEPVQRPSNMPQTGTFIVDVSDLDNPQFVERFVDGTVGPDHNFVGRGDKLYIASYGSGTRVLQINRDAGGTVYLEPAAHMDTEQRLPNQILNVHQNDRFGSSFLGQWGVYVFDSGTIIASDILNGLMIMRLSDEPCRGMACNR
jgi:choice-of-anchor B domain-containing protein